MPRDGDACDICGATGSRRFIPGDPNANEFCVECGADVVSGISSIALQDASMRKRLREKGLGQVKELPREEWQRLLQMREERLKRLRELKAPRDIIANEVTLVMEAKRALEE